uniref:Neutrophil cytosolic factor 2 n=1 Tax=Kryptolebias marmoratus TaxID=37003 RepID=A0A3Q2ZN50_KRYMA
MSFVDTLRQWDDAVTCADRQDWSEALKVFLSIQNPNSKIFFNIGCLQLLDQDLDAAEKAFDCSIRKDEHLAVAFFQRGITFYKKKRYEESSADFQRAFKALRGNQLIDYKALGLRYILYACEVLHNVALAEAQQGNWEKAQERLVKALDYKTETKLSIIDRALQSTLKQKLFKPVEFPLKTLFKPNKHYVAELEKKDYLGKAKVVASVVPQDEFSGFAPLQPQVEGGPAAPREPEVLRALEGEPHTVLFEFVPETSDELAVVPGNIVFVLQKGADNWAYVVFNERVRLFIFLSVWKTKRNVERLLPGLTPGENSRGRTQQNARPTDNSCFIKIHFTFNFVVSVPRGSPSAVLLGKISRKLNLPPAAICLRIKENADRQPHLEYESGMTLSYSSNPDPSLSRLFFFHLQPQKEKVQFVALHSYESSNPEDLCFHQGDTIKLLSTVNRDWLEGQCGGNTGIFPASFVEELPADGQ